MPIQTCKSADAFDIINIDFYSDKRDIIIILIYI